MHFARAERNCVLHVRRVISRIANSDNFHETVKRKQKYIYFSVVVDVLFLGNLTWEYMTCNELKIKSSISKLFPSLYLTSTWTSQKNNKIGWSPDGWPNKSQSRFIKTKPMLCIASHKNNNRMQWAFHLYCSSVSITTMLLIIYFIAFSQKYLHERNLVN